MALFDHGAQRASRRRSFSFLWLLTIAALLASGALVSAPEPVDAATTRKVVIVVGPVGSNTASFKRSADAIASKARGYGARVIKIYSPYATWSRVKAAAAGANLLVYLGHGNGYPSPYGPFQTRTKNGFGLNATYGNGNSNVKYYGEQYVAAYINLARNAVVLFHRLCYASGNSEPGHSNPTRSTAVKRVDNYGAGFLRTGARTVFAEGTGSTSYILYGLFRTNRSMRQIFWSASNATGDYAYSFSSSRTSGARALMDPYRPGRYYRSVIGNLTMTAGTWRNS